MSGSARRGRGPGRGTGGGGGQGSAPTGNRVALGTATPPARSPLRLVLPLALTLLFVAIGSARLAWQRPGVQAFVARYPGVATGADGHPGTPAWVGVLHFLNLFFIALLVKSGEVIKRGRKPWGRWTRRGRPWLARGRRSAPIQLEQWFHVALDALWLASGLVFAVLMATSGRWVRLVPRSWDVFPNAASVALQFLSLHWPHEDSWVAYNALQMLTYFLVVVVLAPLAAVSGWRMSALWPSSPRLDRAYPLARARAVHYPVMIAFVLFVVVHVLLVATTGVLRNLDHMFGARDDASWIGLVMLVLATGLVVVGWTAARPAVVRPLAGLFGKVTR